MAKTVAYFCIWHDTGTEPSDQLTCIHTASCTHIGPVQVSPMACSSGTTLTGPLKTHSPFQWRKMRGCYYCTTTEIDSCILLPKMWIKRAVPFKKQLCSKLSQQWREHGVWDFLGFCNSIFLGWQAKLLHQPRNVKHCVSQYVSVCAGISEDILQLKLAT